MLKEKLLYNASVNLLNGSGKWYSNCFWRSDEVNYLNLPCHLRDDEWLCKLLKLNKKLRFIRSKDVLEYVKESKDFALLRHEYELRIVSWQIDYMLKDGDGWLVPPEYSCDFLPFDANCDLGFRESIILTLTSIGMDKEVIEEGIEKDPHWRNIYMKKAFNNQNNLLFLRDSDIEECKPEYEIAWLDLREYEYYQNHKEMVDKYGTKTNAMQMSAEDAENLKKYVQSEYAKRQEYLKKFNKKIENEDKDKKIMEEIHNYSVVPESNIMFLERKLL